MLKNIVFCIVVLSAVFTFGADEAVLLRYSFEPSAVTKWNVVHRTLNNTTMKETTIDTETYSESEKIWKVIQVKPNGGAVIENSVAWVNLWQDITGKPRVSYDSRKDAEPSPGYERVKSMINVPLAQIELDARGNVVNRKDFFPQSELQLLNPVQLTVPFPENPVYVGDTWRVEQTLYIPKPGSTILKVKTVKTFTLESLQDNIAQITYKTRVLTPIHDPTTEAQIVQCRAKGEMKFDVKAGKSLEHVLSLNHSVPHFSGDASIVKHKNRSIETLIQ